MSEWLSREYQGYQVYDDYTIGKREGHHVVTDTGETQLRLTDLVNKPYIHIDIQREKERKREWESERTIFKRWYIVLLSLYQGYL